jgi:hypothetical protein
MRNAIITFACATLLLACETSETDQTVPANEPSGAAQDDGVIPRSAPNEPVASVASEDESQTSQSYSESMAGAKPGEVRGFMDTDGSKVWGFKSNGEITLRQLAELVFNQKESLDLSPADIERVATTLAKQNGIQPDPDSKPKANSVVVCELKYFAELFEGKGAR